MKVGLLGCVGLSLICFSSEILAQPAATPWSVKKVRWEPSDNKGYSDFVATLGKAVEARKCNSLNSCLHNREANPTYYAAVPAAMTFHADCADLPYVVRAFYAWRNNLPFSFVEGVEPRAENEKGKDLRYTLSGNVADSRKTPISTVSQSLTFDRVKRTVIDHVSSYSYRILDRAGEVYSDFYSPAINRENIIPGTVIYDPNGHVALVYKVADDGNVFFIDAHPDNSLTSGTFGMKFARSRPGQGAGFKNWRPISLADTISGSDGSIKSGKITLAANDQIASFSDEQYWGNAAPRPNDWTKGQFKINGDVTDWYGFVRLRLSKAGSKRDPIGEIKGLVDGLCSDLKYRVDAVELAVKAGIDKRDHPEKLPVNIYGSQGEWEDFSTPSRDARTKTSFVELRDRFSTILAEYARKPQAFQYAGANLKLDISNAYRAAAGACFVTYRNSAGISVKLSYFDLQRRLFKLSFDPYHCPELRWGASGAELSTCPSSEKKQRWYEAEQRLRNQIERRYDDKMDFNIDQLKAKPPGSGMDQAPAINVDSAES